MIVNTAADGIDIADARPCGQHDQTPFGQPIDQLGGDQPLCIGFERQHRRKDAERRDGFPLGLGRHRPARLLRDWNLLRILSRLESRVAGSD